MPTFAEQQLAKIEQILAENPGVQSFTIGNTSTTYDDLMKQRRELKKEVAIEQGQFRRIRRIKLGNF